MTATVKKVDRPAGSRRIVSDQIVVSPSPGISNVLCKARTGLGATGDHPDKVRKGLRRPEVRGSGRRDRRIALIRQVLEPSQAAPLVSAPG